MLYQTYLLDKWQNKQFYQIFHILFLELIYKQFLWVWSHLTHHLSSLDGHLNPLFCLCGLYFPIFSNMLLLGRLTQLSSEKLIDFNHFLLFHLIEVIKVDCMFKNVFSELHKQLIKFFLSVTAIRHQVLSINKSLMNSSLFSKELQTSSKIPQNKPSWGCALAAPTSRNPQTSNLSSWFTISKVVQKRPCLVVPLEWSVISVQLPAHGSEAIWYCAIPFDSIAMLLAKVNFGNQSTWIPAICVNTKSTTLSTLFALTPATLVFAHIQ